MPQKMTNKRPIKIAIAHTGISSDIHENSVIIQSLMKRASTEGCRLIQFPEGSLSGYCKKQITTWEGFNWELLRVELDAIMDLARELSMWVVLGSAHRQDGRLPHNSLFVISDKGGLNTRYDKRLISHGELQGWYSPGETAITFTVDGFMFGLALCLEVEFYEIFDEYRRLGVDGVLLSAYDNKPMFEITARAHAGMNNYWIGFSVPGNMEEPLASSLIGPDGNLQASSQKKINSIAVGVIDRQDALWDIPLNKAKPWRELARKGDIYNKRTAD